MVQSKYFHSVESHKLETLLFSNAHNGEIKVFNFVIWLWVYLMFQWQSQFLLKELILKNIIH